ncbi:MAG: glycosyltransferase family 9 protein [Verrucomicrobia bacterium]|nr:glycosyltransferase family 9 protein [Verrucomicrobiota bacterium]
MKLLVIALAGIGDCLIATPLMHELRLHYPDARLDAFVFWPGSRDLLQGNPHLNTVFQKNLIKEGRIRALSYLLKLRREHYDITLNTHTQGPIHYRVVARLLGAPLRLSHRYECHGPLDNLLVNRTIPQDYEVHCVENNNRLLGLLGKQPLLPAPEMEVFLSPAETAWAGEFVHRHRLEDRPRLGLHVGSGGTKNLTLKRWPLEHYVALLKELNRSHPQLAVLLFGGPEEEKAHAQILATIGGQSIYPVASKDLRQAAALMKHCHAFLSVDTALMHLAAAMKVPNQIVIEAPTLNKTNLPWRTNYRVVPNPMVHGRNLDYYRYDGRPIKGTTEHLLACMASVKVDAVYAAVVQALGGGALPLN